MKILKAFLDKSKGKGSHFSAEHDHEFLRPLHKVTQSWYLNPSAVKKNKGMQWSLRLKITVAMNISGQANDKVMLYMRYKDDRGHHRVRVDETYFEPGLTTIFSGNCALPTRGAISDLHLMLKGVSESANLHIEDISIRKVGAENHSLELKSTVNT